MDGEKVQPDIWLKSFLEDVSLAKEFNIPLDKVEHLSAKTRKGLLVLLQITQQKQKEERRKSKQKSSMRRW